MPESLDPQYPKPRRIPVWVWGIVALVSAVGYAAVRTLGSGDEDISLPPGLTITTGDDSGGGSGMESPSGGSGSLGDLIAATGPGESDRFQASIAILPLENRTGDTLFDTLGTGMTQELITQLSQIRGLKVISQQSVRELEGLSLTVGQVADTLDVDHLLQGTAFLDQDAARIQVRLLRVEEEAELWRNDYSIDRTNQMRAVEDISDEVRAALLEQLPTLSLRSSSRYTDSPGYVSYAAGSRLLNTRSRDGLIRAIEAFRTAIGQDSTFALAYAGLSSAYALSITYRYDIDVDGYAAAGF